MIVSRGVTLHTEHLNLTIQRYAFFWFFYPGFSSVSHCRVLKSCQMGTLRQHPEHHREGCRSSINALHCYHMTWTLHINSQVKCR
jgi:hypothetical protein